MALTTSTLNGAITAEAQSLVITSATDVTAGDYMLIDQEFVRVGKSYTSGTTIPLSGRGLNGTVAAAHVTGANITHGAGSDFANGGAQSALPYPVAGRTRTLTSYTASGAITLPTPGTDAIAVLNGTSVLTMTLASPTKDMDGNILLIVANGKAAHTVAYDDYGDAGNSYDLATFSGDGRNSLMLVAINGVWTVCPSLLAGATALTVTLS